MSHIFLDDDPTDWLSFRGGSLQRFCAFMASNFQFEQHEIKLLIFLFGGMDLLLDEPNAESLIPKLISTAQEIVSGNLKEMQESKIQSEIDNIYANILANPKIQEIDKENAHTILRWLQVKRPHLFETTPKLP